MYFEYGVRYYWVVFKIKKFINILVSCIGMYIILYVNKFCGLVEIDYMIFWFKDVFYKLDFVLLKCKVYYFKYVVMCVRKLIGVEMYEFFIK